MDTIREELIVALEKALSTANIETGEVDYFAFAYATALAERLRMIEKNDLLH